MKEFRITFNDPRGVNVKAETEEEAREIIKNRSWEYGTDWAEDEPEIIEVEDYDD